MTLAPLPLHRFPLCRSSDVHEVTARLNGVYYPATVVPGAGRRFPAASVLHAVHTPDFTLGYIRPGGDVEVTPVEDTTTQHVNLALSAFVSEPTLPERELTRGWLKASNRALDPERSTEWKPFHELTRAAAEPVTPGEVVEYQIEVLATANTFEKGHRIYVEISSMDVPTGVAGATNAEYVPYHVTSSRTTLHTVHHDTARPSSILLPVIPLPTGGPA